MAKKTSGDKVIMVPKNSVKVQFRINPSDERELKTESLWAERVGAGLFRILNSPFFLFGISAEDIVAAAEVGDDLKFQCVISRGGHSTYRIFLQGDRDIYGGDFQMYWAPISAQGATFENANSRFVVVDIPPGKNVHEIYRLFDKGEQDGIWAFEEVHYSGADRDDDRVLDKTGRN